VIFLLALVTVAALLINWLSAMFWQTAGHAGKDIRVVIPQGSSTQQIGQLLKTNGVIDNPLLFRIYLLMSGQESTLQAGDYLFPSGLTIPRVVREMVAGASRFNTVVITIPEGFTVRQIARQLASNQVCSYASFMHAVEYDHFSQFGFWHFLPKSHLQRDRLEGYLFPDTYYFLRHEPATEVIAKILTETDTVLSPAVFATIGKDHLTLPEVMTVASMIEREAELPSERPLIASVIYNRLHTSPPMALQIDATVAYALGGVNHLTTTDLQVNSPYNTYLHSGLPPGPIANPGFSSIEAALHPAHTDYLYYVAKGDGSGGSYFAVTYAQQQRNIARRARNLSARGQ